MFCSPDDVGTFGGSEQVESLHQSSEVVDVHLMHALPQLVVEVTDHFVILFLVELEVSTIGLGLVAGEGVEEVADQVGPGGRVVDALEEPGTVGEQHILDSLVPSLSVGLPETLHCKHERV